MLRPRHEPLKYLDITMHWDIDIVQLLSGCDVPEVDHLLHQQPLGAGEVFLCPPILVTHMDHYFSPRIICLEKFWGNLRITCSLPVPAVSYPHECDLLKGGFYSLSFFLIVPRCSGETWTKEAFGTSYQHPVVNHFLNSDLGAENVYF